MSFTHINAQYEIVGPDQSDQVIGGAGSAGNLLAGLLLVPATITPGPVSVRDGDGNLLTLFQGGAGALSNLVPFFIPLGIESIDGPWKITTGAGVSVLAVGSFT